MTFEGGLLRYPKGSGRGRFLVLIAQLVLEVPHTIDKDKKNRAIGVIKHYNEPFLSVF